MTQEVIETRVMAHPTSLTVKIAPGMRSSLSQTDYIYFNGNCRLTVTGLGLSESGFSVEF